MHQLCGLPSPEDIADLAGTPWLLVSLLNSGDGVSLIALDTRDNSITRIRQDDIADDAQHAGDPACRRPAGTYHPSGIGVRPVESGYRLVVIDRGVQQDKVQFYGVTMDEAGKPHVAWQGCVQAPLPFFLNDIAPMPDGGFAATHMYTRVDGWRKSLMSLKYLLHIDTGYVVRWSPDAGWAQVPNSQGSFPNGLDVSADGKTIYFAETYGRAVNAISPDGTNRRRIPIPMQPDNVTVAPNGKVIAVGGTGIPVFSTAGCPALKSTGCGFPSQAVSIDFKDNKVETLFADDGYSVPGMSVGVVKNGSLFLGTFFGERISRIPLASR